MDVYVGRQPIFDQKLNVYGYKLSYRRSDVNLFEDLDDSRVTADLINDAFLMMQVNELTHGTRAFISFSADLLEKEIPLLLPNSCVVVEIVAQTEQKEKMLLACKKLKNNGYTLALSNFIFEDDYFSLMEVADIIKIDFSLTNLGKQEELLVRYKNKKTFLADKVETRKDFMIARDIGFNLFQGSFFSKPAIMTGKGIQHVSFNLFRVLDELNQEEADYEKITEILERDLGLSYKFLRVANSIALGSIHRTNSMKEALVRIGLTELKKWVYLIMLKEVDNKENKELIRSSVIRAKFMELLAIEIGVKRNHFSYFITGLFSSLNTLLNKDMATVVEELPLPLEVSEALLGKRNKIQELLDLALGYEEGIWGNLENNTFLKLFSEEKLMSLYVKSLAWSMEIENCEVDIIT